MLVVLGDGKTPSPLLLSLLARTPYLSPLSKQHQPLPCPYFGRAIVRRLWADKRTRPAARPTTTQVHGNFVVIMAGPGHRSTAPAVASGRARGNVRWCDFEIIFHSADDSAPRSERAHARERARAPERSSHGRHRHCGRSGGGDGGGVFSFAQPPGQWGPFCGGFASLYYLFYLPAQVTV